VAKPPAGLRWYLVAANYWTLAYLAAGVAAVARAWPGAGWGSRAALALAWLYLLPPLLGRALLAWRGRPEGRLTPETRGYRTWWMLAQLQVVYGRVPLLEEALRIVPGAYSLWLGLWGSRASTLVLWSPGAMVTDRYLLRVERGVVVGTRSTLGPHVVSLDAGGGYELTVAPIVLEAGSVVGALAGVGPGCRVAAGETVPAGRLLPPFTVWKDGRKNAGPRPAA
jgi:hypothetical protein